MTTACVARGPTVSVIVPAYNAAATLAETLASVTAQRYAAIEIIIVDDGSTDRTLSIATRFAAADARIRIATVLNGGVAAARNIGVHMATGQFIAPLDADDLWHPCYLETLVALLLDAPADTVLAYAACRLIDGNGMVIGSGPAHILSGAAPYRMMYCNVVGNGSGMIFARQAAIDLGGYDPRLRAAGRQGYEDYLLQAMLASTGRIVGTGAYLVGYRQGAGTMSRDAVTMSASRTMARRLHRAAFPALVAPRWLGRWIAGEAMLVAAHAAYGDGAIVTAALRLMGAALIDPVATAAAIRGKVRSRWRRRLHAEQAAGVRFLDADPAKADLERVGAASGPGLFVRMQRQRLDAIAALDALRSPQPEHATPANFIPQARPRVR